jgi:hypothetical protein
MYDVATRFDAQIHRVYRADAERALKIVAIPRAAICLPTA